MGKIDASRSARGVMPRLLFAKLAGIVTNWCYVFNSSVT